MIDTHSVPTACEISMTCCILHNLCIMEKDVFYNNLADEVYNNNNANIFQEENAEGILKRDRIPRNFV